LQGKLASMQSWDDLQTFLAILRAGSLQGAARTLGVNHSTIFRRLNTFEARLGVRLFDRLPGGYGPTPAGEDLRAAAERVEQEVQGIERRLLGRDVRLSGSLRVTTTDTLAQGLLAPHLAAFHERYPGIELELVTGNAFFSLSRREADIALRPGRQPDDLMVGRRVGTIAVAVYGARGYLERHAPPRAADELGRHALISGDASLGHLPAVRWLAAVAPSAAVVLRCNSWLSQLALAKAGLGLAALPSFLAEPEPALVRVLGPAPALASELWLLTHPELRRSARVRAFMDSLARSLRAERARLAGEGALLLSANSPT
jgi:DNA-binding transcriptional LysR family regulator